jgi:TonB-dependent receptor
VVTGVRAEQTNITAQGPLTDPTLDFQRDEAGEVLFLRNAAGALVLNAQGQKQPLLIVPTNAGLPYTQRTLIERGTHARKEYLRLFPSINVGYNLTENLVARVAYYQSVGRPDFNQYAGGLALPNVEVFNPNDRITVNNVSIKAWQAQSYLMRLEYYFGNVGNISIGGFIRDYDNLFVPVTSRVPPGFLEAFGLDEETYGVYPVVTQFNSQETVRMKGFEIEYKQALTFLPQWARGVQFFTNVSSQRAKNSFDSLQNMNPFTCNWGLSLTRPKYNFRINENYRSVQRRAAVVGRGIEPGTYIYGTKRLYVDVSGEYYLKRSLGVFFALRNVGDATEDQKTYGPNTPKYAKFRNRDDYAPLWTAGIKGTF